MEILNKKEFVDTNIHHLQRGSEKTIDEVQDYFDQQYQLYLLVKLHERIANLEDRLITNI